MEVARVWLSGYFSGGRVLCRIHKPPIHTAYITVRIPHLQFAAAKFQVPLSAAVQTGARCVQCLRNEVVERVGCWGPLVGRDKSRLFVYGVVYISTKLHIIVEIAYVLSVLRVMHDQSTCCS